MGFAVEKFFRTRFSGSIRQLFRKSLRRITARWDHLRPGSGRVRGTVEFSARDVQSNIEQIAVASVSKWLRVDFRRLYTRISRILNRDERHGPWVSFLGFEGRVASVLVMARAAGHELGTIASNLGVEHTTASRLYSKAIRVLREELDDIDEFLEDCKGTELYSGCRPSVEAAGRASLGGTHTPLDADG